MRTRNRVFGYAGLFCGIALPLLTAGSPLYAQVDTGAILGTIKDQSGAVVPNAKMTLTNEGTSFSLTTSAGSDGSYIFTPIKIGTYSVTVEYQGFQTASHLHVKVDVQQQVVVDFTLQPGLVTQLIEVTAAPPLLETQNASVGQTVGARQVNDLPLNGRNYTFLAQLSAGVTPIQVTGRGLECNGQFAANGTVPADNDYILDGIDNNNNTVDFLNGLAFAIRTPVDAIQEFKVQTSNFSAEFGRAGGAVLNATVKSGTNQVHGDAWEFVRNDKFDAANFFENSGGQQKGEFRRNQFGATLGGPIVVPRLYDGRNKTFFFVDYEATRIRQAAPQIATVPTALERTSGYTNFTELITGQSGTRTDDLGRTFPLGTIFDPATTRTVTQGQVDPVTGMMATASGFVRDPFTGNMLPASRLDPNAISILNLFPAPTASGIFNNFSTDPVIRDNINQFDVRIDHNFSTKDQAFGRISFSDEPKFVPGPFKGVADGGAFNQATYKDVDFNSALSETHSFSPTLINELRYGYSRIRTTQLQPFANTMGIPQQFGIQGIPQIPQNGGLPAIGIAGLNTLGGSSFLPGNRVSDTAQLTENLTKIYGSHTFKGGFELQHLRFPWFAPAWPRGQFNFDGTYTEVPSTGGGNTGMAQLLLSPTATTVPNGLNNVGGADITFASNFAGPDDHRHYYGAYFQDDWKISPRLTLNLGLRWEFFGQIAEKYGAQANFIPSPPGSAQYLITTRRQSTPVSPSFLSTLALDGIKLAYSNTPGLTNTPITNFGPRIGLAYQVTPKLVIRAGYGAYFAGIENIGGSPDIGENYPFLYDFFFFAPDPGHPITYSNGTIANLESGFSGIPLSPVFVNAAGLSLEGVQTNYKIPTTPEYNFTLQYQLSPNQTFQMGYVGNVSRHLETDPGTNLPSIILPPNLNPQNYVAFPDFGRGTSYVTTEGNSIYNSLQVNFERRFSQGLYLLTNYTWSKCRTDMRDLLNGAPGTTFRAPYLANFGIQGDYSLCDFHIPSVVHLSGTWELPFGSGKRFLGKPSGVVNQVVGGWRTNWILTLQDGQPQTLTCPISTTADFGCYPLLVHGQNVYGGRHDVNHWLNPAAFTNPPVATTIGQTDYSPLGGGPTQVLGPGFHRLDFSLFKQFRTSETTHLELRAEFFNLTNHPNFSYPSFTDYTNSASFGTITSVRDGANDQREIQFALKFYW